MSEALQEKLAGLPKTAGVYFFKDIHRQIIYVGKAAVLRNRVRQYFQGSRGRDVKTEVLVGEIVDIEWLSVGSEIEALFLESEMIKRYLPKYNIELRDDKHYQYVRIDFKAMHPTVRIVRRPMDDGAEYYGPYIGGVAQALKFLRRAFPFDYSDKPSGAVKRASLHYHLGLSPGLEAGKTALADYRANLRKLAQYLKGRGATLRQQLAREMKQAAKAQHYEQAALLRNQVEALARLQTQIIFSDKELFDISKDQALNGLAELLGLRGLPRRIEGYDISHMSGTDTVASMVVFSGGVSDKHEYRKFKLRVPGNDDFAHMHEVITRRFGGYNLARWPQPDLLLIDGGKGQLGAALKALDERGLGQLPAIGLAKRFEEIMIRNPDGTYQVVRLDRNAHVVKLLQRIRDESHRFAVSYHSVLKTKRQTVSKLEQIPSIGPVTRRKLIRAFGSLRGVTAASEAELAAVVGAKTTRTLLQHLNVLK